MRKAAAAVSVALVAAVFTAVLLGVARRYLFGAPLT
jgi:TRAP-type C4-dicarboxylate transport system permease small subunit